jgi:hypothetical protein
VCLRERRRSDTTGNIRQHQESAMAAILARLKMTFDGQTYATKERATEIDIGGADNEPVMDSAAIHTV